MGMHVFAVLRFEFFFCDLANEMQKNKDQLRVAHAYIRQPNPERAHVATCLMNIATPTGLAQVSVKDSEWKIVRRGTPTCGTSSPSRADTTFTITRVRVEVEIPNESCDVMTDKMAMMTPSCANSQVQGQGFDF
jgi:Tfp pilus assembly protein PilW